VVIRCCPTKADAIIKITGDKISLQRPKTTLTKTFKFADIHTTTAGTGDVHERSVSEHVRAVVSGGESVTVLSFGARSTGKTITIRSRDGVVLRAATDVFVGLGLGDKCMITVSCLISAVAPPAQSPLTGRQVTHEILLDGMLPQGEVGEYKGGLNIREHPTKGFFVEGLSEISVDSLTECEDYLRRALANCASEEARCGVATLGAPLRVHCLFTIRVRRKNQGGESVSDVQILDLAGWVRDKPASKGAGGKKGHAAVVGEDMVVKAFQRIVSSLEAKASHIPYRDSKMTRVLQPALGGSALCIPLVHIAVDNYEETEAMLALATKLATITCKVKANMVDYGAELAAKQTRVEALCRKLGRRPQGLKSADIIMGMNCSQDLLELRDTLYAMELQQRDGNEWAKAEEASQAFKADGGAAATMARLDRKPKKDPRFKEITNDTSVNAEQLRSQQPVRNLPPARGHGNNTPRGVMYAKNDNADSTLLQITASSETVDDTDGRADALFQKRNRSREAVTPKVVVGDGADRAGRTMPPAGGGACGRERTRLGGNAGGEVPRQEVAIPQGDIDSITARLAKMQQQETPVRATSIEGRHRATPGSAGGAGVATAPANMGERLALLKQSKPQASRLRSMS